MRALLIVAVAAGTAGAEPGPEPSAGPDSRWSPTLEEMRRVVEAAHKNDDKPEDTRFARAMTLQGYGASLMGAGIYHLVGATIAGGFAYQDYACGKSAGCETWGVATAAAWATFTLGIIFTAAGIPTYIEGTTRLKKMGIKARLDLDGLRVTF